MGWFTDLLNKLTGKQPEAQNTGGNMATWIERVSGADRSTYAKGQVAGTDLLIPYLLENGSVGFLGGDSFKEPFPGAGPPSWRSPVGFRSNVDPTNAVITFDSAYGAPANANGNFLAPEITPNAHAAGDFNAMGVEFTVIPNDAIAFPQTGRHIMSFMSINRWRNNKVGNMNGIPGDWRSNYNAIGYSDDGNHFYRLPGGGPEGHAIWENNEQNSNPFQMMTFADGGDGYVYCYSVRSGRQNTPMMLQRVPWDKMFYKAHYQGWNNNGGTWHWGGPDECTSLFPNKLIGEPSVRKLSDGTWAMAYLTTGGLFDGGMKIVTRTASSPTGPWSAEKTQVTALQEQNLYGGFIHPYSKAGTNKLSILVSKWNAQNYHVSQFRGTL